MSVQDESLRRSVLAKLIGIAVVVLPALWVGITNWRHTYDDAFITYRYAYNLATGQGFVYNPGEWFMGTTAPLYGLILGGLGAMTSLEAIPLISGLISALSLVLTGVALYEYGDAHRQPFCGLLAGLFYVVNPLVAMAFGGEILFQIMLIAWAFVLYGKERTLLAAMLLALATLTRPDGLAAAVVVCIHYVLTRRRLPLRELAVAAAMLLPFIVLAWMFYGSPVPGTLRAKMAQGSSGLWSPFGVGAIEWLKAFTVQGSSGYFPKTQAFPNAIRFILFVAVGLPATLWLFRFQLLPLAWVILFTLGYSFLHVAFYHWYVTPIVFGLMILASAGVAGVVELARRAAHVWFSSLSSWIFMVLVVVCLAILSPGLYAQFKYAERRASGMPFASDRLYEQAGRWLEANTPSTARVGYFEIGVIGFYSRRPIVDPLGLITPGAATHVASRDFVWAYAHYRPDYILTNQMGPVAQVTELPWFKQEYCQIASLSERGYPSPLGVYERRASCP